MNRTEPQELADITEDTGTYLTPEAEEDLEIDMGIFTLHESKMPSTDGKMALLQERTARTWTC